jgi:hypothetical protein
MLETGILILFMIPGVAAYAALYGLFHNGKAVAPEPPSANSVEAAVVIIGASVLIHTVTAIAFAVNSAACQNGCPVKVPVAWLDPYAAAVSALSGKGIAGTALAMTLTAVVVQGAAAYAGTRQILASLAHRDRLPAWIYGWAKPLADSLDNDDTVILAYVLTDIEQNGKSVVYGGLLNDMALKSDGCVSRITLTACERYLVDLGAPLATPSLSTALSNFPFMVIDAAHIRNIAFETLTLPNP